MQKHTKPRNSCFKLYRKLVTSTSTWPGRLIHAFLYLEVDRYCDRVEDRALLLLVEVEEGADHRHVHRHRDVVAPRRVQRENRHRRRRFQRLGLTRKGRKVLRNVLGFESSNGMSSTGKVLGNRVLWLEYVFLDQPPCPGVGGITLIRHLRERAVH